MPVQNWLMSSLLVEPGKCDLQQLHFVPCQVLGQAVLGSVSVAAAFLVDLSDGLSFLLNEFKSGWHAVKLKSNIQILCWAEAHPKNVCGLVGAFPLYLHPRKRVLKCKNLVLLIVLFLKSHSCCLFPPLLFLGKRGKFSIFCCSKDGFFFQCRTWTLSEPTAGWYHLYVVFRFLPPAVNDLSKDKTGWKHQILYSAIWESTKFSILPYSGWNRIFSVILHLSHSRESWNRHFGVQGRKANLLNVDYSLSS